MNSAPLLLLALAFLTPVGSAQDKDVPVPELEKLQKEYASLVTGVDGPHLAALAELNKNYIARLKSAQETAQQAGKLDEALALDEDKKAVSSGSGVPAEDDAKTPGVLRKLRATYRAETAKLEVVWTRNHKPLRNDYAAELDALVLRLTKDGKLKEAMTVRKFRESLPAVSVATATSAGASQNPEAGKVMSIKLSGGVVMKFCSCPPGNDSLMRANPSFKMGSPPDEPGRRREEDQVRVKLSKGFWMAQTECTQEQWVAVMGNNPSGFKGDDLPVDRVSWLDVQKFIAKLNETKTLPAGWKAALPTEAQWEYACRAGTKTAFSFGETINAKQANFANTVGKTCAVASYPANRWGLYDMHGNVWEWCEDWYGNKLVGGTDPTGVTSGSRRVVRGGFWVNDADAFRVRPPALSTAFTRLQIAIATLLQ